MGLASDGIRACVNFDGDDGVSCVASVPAAVFVAQFRTGGRPGTR